MVKNDGSPVPHQYVDLTRHENDPLKITQPGYLYCFPNDVWSLYENNHGSVQLKSPEQDETRRSWNGLNVHKHQTGTG